MRKRFLAALLCLCMIMAMLPTTAFAAEELQTAAIQLGADVLNKNKNTSAAATVYYGDQTWRVVGYNGGGVAKSSNRGAVTLIAAKKIGSSKFAKDANDANAYASSILRAQVEAIAGGFTVEEKLAVVKRRLEVGTYSSSDPYCDGIAGAAVENALLWPLSAAEANDMNSDLRVIYLMFPVATEWWLRSPGSIYRFAAYVSSSGTVYHDGVHLMIDSSLAIRPAFNLNLSDVLFTSAAVGGKSAEGMDTALTGVPAATNTEWKLTLKDYDDDSSTTLGHDGFTAGLNSASSATVAVGGSVSVDYSGAATGSNEYISAMLVNGSGTVIYYGNIANNSASGTAQEITIPAGLATGSYMLKIFNEQVNGDCETDYSSEFKDILLTVTAPVVPATAIQLGAGGIEKTDKVYFGNYSDSPIKWRVLDTKTNMAGAKEGDGLFLLSDVLLGTETNGGVCFDYAKPYTNAWQDSDAQMWCNTFETSSLSANELAAIIKTSKEDGSFTSSTYYTFAAATGILNDDQVFFLSAEEAEKSDYGFANNLSRIANYGASAGVWWLRSPYVNNNSLAGVVESGGTVRMSTVYGDWAVRPAFNLDLNSVLFTSAATGGKSSGATGAGALKAVRNDAPVTDWKLTLKDSSRSEFTVSLNNPVEPVNPNHVVVKAGDSFSINYSGAKTGSNEYISAILINPFYEVLYYGKIANNSASDPNQEITIPANLASGIYGLKIFNEQLNGDEKTDYASEFKDIIVWVRDTTAPTLTPGAANRISNTSATVTFTSDEAASYCHYYYQVVENGAEAPTIDTGKEGTVCDKTEQTITLDGLTAGAKDIYIVVKDGTGNVSAPLKITIPAYVLTLAEENGVLKLTVTVELDAGDIVLWAEYDESGRMLSCQAAASGATRALPDTGHTVRAFWLDAGYAPRAAAAAYPLVPNDWGERLSNKSD